MTVAYSVNGGSEILGVDSVWKREIKSRDPATGAITFQNYATNTLTVPDMTMTLYLVLQALSGSVLTSLETNDITDRNVGATYNSGVEMGIVNCQHVGLAAQGIVIKFRVKV